ncbi:MAG: hypothetical protein ACRED2_01315, partial [Methylocella sp.]
MRYFPRCYFPPGLFFGLGMALLVSGCSGSITGEDLLLSPSNYEVGGIDVSKYQGDIDWNSVRAAGVRFAWI